MAKSLSNSETIPDGIPFLGKHAGALHLAKDHCRIAVGVLEEGFFKIARELDWESEKDANTLVYYVFHLDKVLTGFEHGTRWIREVFDETSSKWDDFLHSTDDRLLEIRLEFQRLFRTAAAPPGATEPADLFRALTARPDLDDDRVRAAIDVMIHGPALDLARSASQEFGVQLRQFLKQIGEGQSTTRHSQDANAAVP